MNNTELAEEAEPRMTVLEEFQNFDWRRYQPEEFYTALDPQGPIIRKEVYVALMQSEGNLGKAAAMLNRPRDTLRRWLNANPDMKVVSENLVETAIDNIEETAFKQAIEGDGAQVRFLLQTKGKNRGYSTRVENTGADGAPLELMRQVEVHVTAEQMQRLAEEIQHRVAGTGRTVNG